jgi:hypothetical protein
MADYLAAMIMEDWERWGRGNCSIFVFFFEVQVIAVSSY